MKCQRATGTGFVKKNYRRTVAFEIRRIERQVL